MGSGSASRFCFFFFKVCALPFSVVVSVASAGASAIAVSPTGSGDLTVPFAWRFLLFLGAVSLEGPPSKTSNMSSSMVGGCVSLYSRFNAFNS
jgi:hypothetical protein